MLLLYLFLESLLNLIWSHIDDATYNFLQIISLQYY